MDLAILKDKNKRTGLIGTIVFHLILLLLFMVFGLTYMVPKPEQGILINFGTSDQGMGEVQPEAPPQPTETTQEETPQPEETPAETTPVEEDIMTQEDVETVEVVDKEEQRKKEEERKKKEEERKKQEEYEKRMAEIWEKTGKGGNEGETGEPGDQGSVDGSKEGESYTGGGNGKGYTFSLSGRDLVSVPKIVDTSQEEGKVVVDIIVDRYGKVVKAVPGARGSTTTNTHLFKKAKEAALKTKFSPNPDAPAEQKGVMTFVFVLQ